MIKSPLRYPGGKSRAVGFLQQCIPDFREFREVFFGGGSLSFFLAQTTVDKKIIASDLNYELFCFWSQLQRNTKAVADGVQQVYDQYKSPGLNASAGKDLFYKLVERRHDNLSELERAIDFYILNRITFSGVVDSGGYSQGSFDGRFTQSSIERLYNAAKIVEPIEFYCEDYIYLLNLPGKDVFIFLDPPYYNATKSKLYGKKGILHTEFDHQKLFQCLKSCKHKWMMTYDNSEFIKDLYKDFFLMEWHLQYGMTMKHSDKGKRNELLIANFDVAEVYKNKSYSHNLHLVFDKG